MRSSCSSSQASCPEINHSPAHFGSFFFSWPSALTRVVRSLDVGAAIRARRGCAPGGYKRRRAARAHRQTPLTTSLSSSPLLLPHLLLFLRLFLPVGAAVSLLPAEVPLQPSAQQRHGAGHGVGGAALPVRPLLRRPLQRHIPG